MSGHTHHLDHFSSGVWTSLILGQERSHTTLTLRTVQYPFCQYEYEYVYPLIMVRYGNMVDFSFIVSLYVSDLFNVTTSTVPPAGC